MKVIYMYLLESLLMRNNLREAGLEKFMNRKLKNSWKKIVMSTIYLYFLFLTK